MIHRFKTIKRSSLWPNVGMWANWYLIDIPVSDDGSQPYALGLMQAEAGIHLQHVEFLACAVDPVSLADMVVWGDDDSEQPGVDTGSRCWVPRGVDRFGLLPSEGSEQPTWTIHVKKQCNLGRNGHQWYRGCLTDSDVWHDDDNHIKLLTVDKFGPYVRDEFHFKTGVAVSDFYVQHGGLAATTFGRFEPVKAHSVSGALLSNKLLRARARVPDFRVGYADAIFFEYQIAEQEFGQLLQWQGDGVNTNPVDSTNRATRVIDAAYAASEAVLHFGHRDHNGIDHCEEAVTTRTGPYISDLLAHAQFAAKFECQEGAQDSVTVSPSDATINTHMVIDGMQPDVHFAGIDYYSSDQLSTIIETVRPFVREARFFLRGDYYIPRPRGQ